MANLAQVHFLPVWKRLEGEKQVRFRMSMLVALSVRFDSILGELMKVTIKRLSSWLAFAYCTHLGSCSNLILESG